MVVDIDRRYILAAAVLVLILVFAGGMKYANMKNRSEAKQELILNQAADDKESEKNAEDDMIQVYIAGAVEKPGVYKLQSGARVYEAIDMAKSLPSADLKNINLAQKLEDGQPIIVPLIGEATITNSSGGGLSTGASSANSGKVNINTASVQELDEKLPGIGPTLAQRIVESRPYTQIEDLKEVSGIGDKKFADIKDLVTVR